MTVTVGPESDTGVNGDHQMHRQQPRGVPGDGPTARLGVFLSLPVCALGAAPGGRRGFHTSPCPRLLVDHELGKTSLVPPGGALGTLSDLLTRSRAVVSVPLVKLDLFALPASLCLAQLPHPGPPPGLCL